MGPPDNAEPANRDVADGVEGTEYPDGADGIDGAENPDDTDGAAEPDGAGE